MPFDGFFARAVAAELQALEGAKVERVNHTAKEYVELCLYVPGTGRRTLVISVCPSDARVALTDEEESRAGRADNVLHAAAQAFAVGADPLGPCAAQRAHSCV